ncbi:MAG: enolase C-terminal domain-like protein [Polyangiaceae bacterium]
MTWHVVPWGGEVAGVRSARVEFPERRGLLVVLREDDVSGYGEATPLPGFGDDDLQRATAELDGPLPTPADRPGAVLAKVARFRSPSARFAVECALLDHLARRRGVALHELFRADARPVLRSVLVGELGAAGTLERAQEAAERGARVLKLKATGRNLQHDRAALVTLRSALGDCVRLRLDLNGCLTPDEAGAALAVYGSCDIELVEEPTSADALSSLGPGSVPWFADESAIDAARFEALLAHDPCAGFVLKPTALGGFFAALERTQLARQAKKRVIVSHAFDGPVALAAAAELSLVIGGEEAHGLDVHAALTAFPRVTIPRLGERGSPLAVGVHPAPGLGFELEGRWLA